MLQITGSSRSLSIFMGEPMVMKATAHLIQSTELGESELKWSQNLLTSQYAQCDRVWASLGTTAALMKQVAQRS